MSRLSPVTFTLAALLFGGCGAGGSADEASRQSAPTESARSFSGEEQRVAQLLEDYERANRHSDVDQVCEGLTIDGLAASRGDPEGTKTVAQCRQAVQAQIDRTDQRSSRFDITVTAVKIACEDYPPDALGVDACADARVTIDSGKGPRPDQATLVRADDRWYLAYFGPG